MRPKADDWRQRAPTMIEPTDAVLALARRTLGPITLTPLATLPTHVMAFVDQQGHQYLAKRHTAPHRYTQEVEAYTRWIPAIHGRAPQLIATDAENLILLLTALSGATADRVPAASEAERTAHQG